MGSKSAAKALMERSGVPMVPGYHGEDQDISTLAEQATRIGYPVLIKASAGGGGKGMRVASDAASFVDAVAGAKREAKAAFGDDHVLIERYVLRPRHIEVQIFGDAHGNVVSLFERECTLQRRHQKVVEEAPAANLSEDEGERISAAARAAAAAVSYVGAGTVEFVANDDGFYFIEMNTRLQVEHPVTEMITGLDLVEWQIRVAFGEALPLAQEEITRSGHAFEVRLYAEDPDRGFLPAIGRIESWRQPETGNGIRIDSGFRPGDRVTPYYDPMLAKLIVHGPDRMQALDRLADALAHFQITGIRTNGAFLHALITHPAVRSGDMDTGLIERELAGLLSRVDKGEAEDIAAAVAAVLARERRMAAESRSPWDRADGWMIAGCRKRVLHFDASGKPLEATLAYRRDGLELTIGADTRSFEVNLRPDGKLDVFFGDRKETVSAVWNDRDVEIAGPRGHLRLHWADPYRGEDADIADANHFRAPMPGSVLAILARPGERLERGAPVLILEAMKMEHMLKAPADGILTELKCAVGDFVSEGTELAIFDIGGGAE
jgi:3-methylcrotonyl-CoA carboxylase alpha subunit